MAKIAKNAVPLGKVVWANIRKWMIVRDVTDEEISALLGITRLYERIKTSSISVAEMDSIAKYLAVEPEKLLER